MFSVAPRSTFFLGGIVVDFLRLQKVALSGDGCAKGVELMAQERIC